MSRFIAIIAIIGVASATFALDDIEQPAAFYDGDSHAAKTVASLRVTNLTVASASVSVTNGQTGVSLSTALLTVIQPGSDAGTNTITLAAPNAALVGRVCVIQVATSATGLLAIADSGTVSLSSAFSGGAGDILGLLATSTGTWSQIFTSNN